MLLFVKCSHGPAQLAPRQCPNSWSTTRWHSRICNLALGFCWTHWTWLVVKTSTCAAL